MIHKYASVIIFITLITSSAATSLWSYRAMERRIVADLNSALADTIAEKRDGWLANDTIRAYRSLQGAMDGSIALNSNDEAFRRRLTIPGLREAAYLRLVIAANGDNGIRRLGSDEGRLCSDTVVVSNDAQGASMAISSYARCTAASVFAMSNQRPALALCLAAMLWAVLSTTYMRRKAENHVAAAAFTPCTAGDRSPADAPALSYYGRLALSADGECFYNGTGARVMLTPMQHQLMRMFFESPTHRLTKKEICDTLWPRKDDASETLYTLVRRLKTVLADGSGLWIETERGRAYRLTDGADELSRS